MATKQSGGMLKWLIIFLAIAAVAAGGFWYFKRGADAAPQYETMPVARGDLTQVVTATGTLNPVVNVTVGSQVSGRITRLFVDFNSIVKSNEVIAEIDPSTYEAQLNQARANLANARANLELQQVNLQRAEKLYTNNLIAGSDYDTAVATRDEAAAAVQIQEASVTNATANLGYCKILSPVDGVVISRAVDLGQTVASSFSTPTLFQIANDLTKMQIDTAVDEADIGGVKEGQAVDFTVDAYPNRTFHGVVIQVRNAPTTVNNVVTYDTVIGVTNSDYSLKPGMTASVSIVVAEHNDVLEIPNAALRFQPSDMAAVETNALATTGVQNTNSNNGGQPGNRGGRRGGWGGRGGRGGHEPGEHSLVHTVYVLVKDATGKNDELKAVQVKTGITDNINTEVLSGLNEGDPVVTGLAIPGLTSSGQTRNPFAGGRRF
ncbi:MAG TPA: efflux RND transporter periplasmic adaptor subunit [Candidatus Paceibacterota bacterium]|nr:efflux RND transporter periplasmic adaptor subunit [Candidatus Paceibacterota bacterium]